MLHESPAPPGECADLFARLSAYLDGELSPEARQAMEQHICDCPPCIEFIQSLRQTIDLCHHFEPAGTPAPVSREAKRELLAALQRALAARDSGR
jgi:anti-sigma factor RsiW